MNKFILRLAVLLGFSLLATSAFAEPITFQFHYVGTTNTAARGVGSITMERSLIPNPSSSTDPFIALPNPLVTALNITITGANSGNGTFTLADFSEIAFTTNDATLNLNTQLFGQPTPGLPWGTTPSSGEAGDFNLFGIGAGSRGSSYADIAGTPASPSGLSLPPSGTFFFTLTTNDGAGDAMVLRGFGTPQTVSSNTHSGLLGLLGLLLLTGLVTMWWRSR